MTEEMTRFTRGKGLLEPFLARRRARLANGKADFAMEKIRSGYFELGLNMWATAER